MNNGNLAYKKHADIILFASNLNIYNIIPDTGQNEQDNNNNIPHSIYVTVQHIRVHISFLESFNIWNYAIMP